MYLLPRNSGKLKLLEPLRVCPALYTDCFTFVCLDYYVLGRLMTQEEFTALMYQESFKSHAEVSLVTTLVS